MSLVTQLPSIFSQFLLMPANRAFSVMELKEQGVPLVGTYCTFGAAGDCYGPPVQRVVSPVQPVMETIEEAEKPYPANYVL